VDLRNTLKVVIFGEIALFFCCRTSSKSFFILQTNFLEHDLTGIPIPASKNGGFSLHPRKVPPCDPDPSAMIRTRFSKKGRWVFAVEKRRLGG
jgi:hypothetical protein